MTVLLVGAVSSQFQNKQFFSGGGCSQIKGLGSPILMVANAHKYINDALNSKNPYTDVALYFFNSALNTTTNATNYRLLFAVTSLKGLEYFAIDFDVFGNGIGSMKINRMLITSNLNWVGTIFSIDTTALTEINCGDLKFMFSFYGQDPTADLPFVFPGRNQNSIGLGILNRLNIENQNNGVTNKVCIDANYTGELWIDSAGGTATPFDGIAAGDTTANCIPTGLPIATFDLECGAAVDLLVVDVTKNNLDGTQTTESLTVGPAVTPTTFDLQEGDVLEFKGEDTAYFSVEQFRNGASVAFLECGTFVGPFDYEVSMLAENFLGFSDPTADPVTDLVVVEYTP